jgi:hypothetical protein
VRLLIAPILILSFAIEGDGPQRSDNQSERLRAMRVFADGVVVQPTSLTDQRKLERLAEPIYRFDDPARRFSDGSVWAWGRSGRPAALLTLAKERATAGGGYQWLAELTSLASEPVSAVVPEIGHWRPSATGVVMRNFPKAPSPGEDALTRLRQMRELVRQIKAYEFFAPDNESTPRRYELRILPQPVHRYADAKSGLIDGGLFMISYGLNPELALLVEARSENSLPPKWSYGVARISIAQVHVDFDGKEIWSHPGGYSQGPQDIYWLFTQPIESEF